MSKCDFPFFSILPIKKNDFSVKKPFLAPKKAKKHQKKGKTQIKYCRYMADLNHITPNFRKNYYHLSVFPHYKVDKTSQLQNCDFEFLP